MTTRTWTAEGYGNSVQARTEASARRKLERMAGCGLGRVYRDEEAEAYAELPDCGCGWRGTGSGRNGAIVRGDRCPSCGASLD